MPTLEDCTVPWQPHVHAAWEVLHQGPAGSHAVGQLLLGEAALVQALPAQSERFRRQALVELMESALRPPGASASPRFAFDLDPIQPAAQPQSEVRAGPWEY